MKTNDLLVKMYYQMLRIRMVEEKLIELWELGELRSLMHLSTGQEAVAVGVCNALAKNDSVVSTHRCHAHYLAKGGSLKKMLAELAGKEGGCCGGKGGSMHLFDPDVGMNLSVPLVGGSIPISVGIALANKMRNRKRISVAFFGDGAVEEGVFWESLNFAAVHQLPVLFVCENNFYATHSHILKRQWNANIANRIEPHGFSCMTVDGNDVYRVYEMAERLVGYIRQGLGPAFIEAKTYRWKEHWGPGEDWHLGYRTKEEGDKWKARCPIGLLKQKLIELKVKVDFGKLNQTINNEIEEAVVFAKQSPEPQKSEFFQWAED